MHRFRQPWQQRWEKVLGRALATEWVTALVTARGMAQAQARETALERAQSQNSVSVPVRVMAQARPPKTESGSVQGTLQARAKGWAPA